MLAVCSGLPKSKYRLHWSATLLGPQIREYADIYYGSIFDVRNHADSVLADRGVVK